MIFEPKSHYVIVLSGIFYYETSTLIIETIFYELGILFRKQTKFTSVFILVNEIKIFYYN